MKVSKQKDIVKKFRKNLKTYEDKNSNSLPFINFFRTVLRGNDSHESLPIIEMISVLKHQKPTIFYTMKRQATGHLQMIVELDMDPAKAEKKLDAILNEDTE